ncbi:MULTISPECIES: hypothetical protein [Nonomuraea]|uniref:Uncharacterized protein n=1 Tax=Nonomuraea mangrovi TaxID=2316207 RepID=A0ABW4SNT4_9ACTN
MKVRTPDGRSLSVSGNAKPFIGGWAYIVWAFGPEGGLRFYVTPAGSAEVIGKQLGEWGKYTVREAGWNGGTLRSLEDPEAGGTTMMWIGPHHEISTYVNGVGVPFEVFMDKLAAFDVQDAPEGLTMLPRAGSGMSLANLLAVNTIDQVCSVQVKPLADVASDVPRTRGKQVRGGSMWRVDDHDESGQLRSRSALLVNRSTATTVMAARSDDPQFVSVVESITCELN